MATRQGTFRRPHSLLGGTALLLATVTMLVASRAQTQEAESYEGRPIADVMSYRGAPWLEREDRDAEENPAALVEKLALRPGMVVADIGCGSGFYSRRIAPHLEPGGKVLAVDIQPEMLRILETLAERDGLENVEAVLGTPDDPKLPQGAVDRVLLVDVYHEMQDPGIMLRRLRDSLSPDGLVFLVEFRLEGDSARHIKLEHRMSVEQVRREWEPAGFALVELWEELPTQHVFIYRRSPTSP